MAYNFKTLALAAALSLAGAIAPLSAQTLGEQVASGELTIPAVQQLIVGTGLTLAEGLASTLDAIVTIRWQDD